jgi:aspartyl/asparaginyl beta-hydroxylase (cupin superfamily)
MESETLSRDTVLDVAALAGHAYADLASRFPEGELARVRGFLDIVGGRAEPSFHPLQSTKIPRVHFPGLPAEPFYETALFAEMPALEAAYEAVREETSQFLTGGVTAAQYESRREPTWPKWKKFVFYDGGPHRRQDENCRAFPVTSALVDRIAAGYEDFLSAGFLVHDGRMTIEPHIDWFNLYVSLWLPVFVPPGCGLEVGGQQRLLEAGTCIAFDNSFMHSSWNHSDEPRIVLALYRLTPRLTHTEARAFVHLKKTYARLFQPATSAR